MTELAAWYQKKIGTYDKQEWETTIEQRILHGLAQVPLKSTKLRPDLIDVDLIRGSSFPKAKPVQGLGTVVRLALARVLLLPLWKGWWAAHTSLSAARLLLVLWALQGINTALYFLAPASVHLDATCILVPLFLMCGLGVVHALIVSTAPPRPTAPRYRSVSNDERRQRCRLSVSPEKGILRKDNHLSADDSLLGSEENVFYSTEEIRVITVSTQTRGSVEDASEEAEEWQRTFGIPTVSLTPPSNGQSVSFELGGQRLMRGEPFRKVEVENPVLGERRRNENPRNPSGSAEGDDGFESLNGNNSNGSENGDELDFNGDVDEVKDGHESDEENEDDKDAEAVNLCDNKIPIGILYESKLRKRVNVRKSDLEEKSCDREEEDGREKWLENNVVSEDVSIGSESTVRIREGPRACSDGGSSTNLSTEPGGGGRREKRCKTGAGVRFRNSWVQEMLEQRNSLSEGVTRKPRKDCTSCPSSSEEECDTPSASLGASQHTDWVGQTTNSEECSYSSEPEESEWEGRGADPAWEPCAILSPASDRVSCTIWERGRILKAPLSAVDISRAVVHRADRTLARCSSGFWPGPAILAPLLAFLPTATRLIQVLVDSEAAGTENVTVWDLPAIFIMNSPFHAICTAFGSTAWERVMNLISWLLRLGLGALVFFLLSVAERAFRQRFFYAKLFSHLTSARRARQSFLPHFRLNRVRNIKTWLSVRSYLKRRGPQRSVDVIVSAAFFMMVLLISYLVIELLKETGQTEMSKAAEALGWALALGAALLRLAALGTRAARKHRCLPVLLTEQINLHLAMERRPASKERLAVANNVLKLAADLLKELESPFKISGLSANPYLYTITKVVVLSALSGVLSELLGFKLKLHKIKIK